MPTAARCVLAVTTCDWGTYDQSPLTLTVRRSKGTGSHALSAGNSEVGSIRIE